MPLLQTKRMHCYLAALLTLVVVALPEIAVAQQGPGMASPAVRDACRAQVRALGIRGMGGGNAERHRFAVFRQCLRNRARV